jgi:UDP-N-acetylglucosamine 2-epimerase (non-hydrolysing)
MILAAIGTRPEAIKMAPVVHALRERGIEVEIVATGQHHDFKMLGTFLETFALTLDHELALPSRDLLGSFTSIMTGLGQLIIDRKPAMVLAQGDTTTVVAAAFAARKLNVPFGHIEAGLRAFSRELPEEEHRICADALADLLFAPTRVARENLEREHVNGEVILTGNTVLDALRKNPPPPAKVRQGVLVTLHRQETVDYKEPFSQALTALGELAKQHKVTWPMHPRAHAKMTEFGLAVPAGVEIVGPLGYREFLAKLVATKLLVTDSGGAQEEAAILGTPCISVRRCTERPETITSGVGVLSGVDAQSILEAAEYVLKNWEKYARPSPHLYGDGHAGEKIAAACAKFLGIEPQESERPLAANGPMFAWRRSSAGR